MPFRFTNLIILFITILLANTALGQQGPGLQWVGAMGGGASNLSNDQGRSIVTDDQFNVYVTRYFTDTIDLDFSSGTSNAISNGSNVMFIQKLDFAGNFFWAKTIGGSWREEAFDMKLDTSGNVYITGNFSRTVDFDPGTGVHNLTVTTFGGNNGFILKLDNSGNFLWVKKIRTSHITLLQQMALDSLNNIYLTGSFYGTTDLDPGSGTSIHTSNGIGYMDAFVEEFDSNGSF